MRSREVVPEVTMTMDMWVRKEKKAGVGGQRKVVTHCQFTMEQVCRVGMREGRKGREEGTPEHFLNSVHAKYEEEVVKEQGRQREASRASYRAKARWREGKVREESREKGGVIGIIWKGVLVTDNQLNKEKEKRDEVSSKNFITLYNIRHGQG